jgi:AcrR family transcriptional regulator
VGVTIDDGAVERPAGRRGRATRQRLLEATAALLESGPYRTLTVVDIARDAGTSPAAFYQYFADAEDAVLALASDLADTAGPALAASITGVEWARDDAMAAALGVADAFLDLWERDRAILRVVDLATDEGDQRFRDVRSRMLNAPSEAFVAVLRELPPGTVTDPLADAGVLVSMLAHVAAHVVGLQTWGAGRDELRHTMARVVASTLTGQLSSFGAPSARS